MQLTRIAPSRIQCGSTHDKHRKTPFFPFPVSSSQRHVARVSNLHQTLVAQKHVARVSNPQSALMDQAPSRIQCGSTHDKHRKTPFFPFPVSSSQRHVACVSSLHQTLVAQKHVARVSNPQSALMDQAPSRIQCGSTHDKHRKTSFFPFPVSSSQRHVACVSSLHQTLVAQKHVARVSNFDQTLLARVSNPQYAVMDHAPSHKQTINFFYILAPIILIEFR
jgi:hypothetical protein